MPVIQNQNQTVVLKHEQSVSHDSLCLPVHALCGIR
jgi:hypothetical protein